jgi:hypothetical protein
LTASYLINVFRSHKYFLGGHGFQPCRKRLGKGALAPEESWYFRSSDL